MAQYGYMNRGYTAQGNGRPAARIQPWNSSYNEVEPRSQWNKTGFVTNYEECHDHRCSPEIVACIPDDNTQFIVTRRETIVEHVHTPLVTRYKDSSPTRVAPSVTRYKDSSPTGAVPLVTRYNDSSPTRVAPLVTRYKNSSPTRVAPSVTRYKDSSPTGAVPSVTRYSDSSPTRVAPFVTRYHDSSPTEAVPLVTRYKDSSPTTVAPLVTKYQDGSPTGAVPSVTRCIDCSPTTVAPSVTRYIDSSPTTVPPLVTRYKDSSPPRVAPTKDYGRINKEWSKPVNPSHERPPVVDEFITKVQTEASRPARMGPLKGTYWRGTPKTSGGINGYSDIKSNYEPVEEPTMVTTDGWTRPSRVGWATPPSHDPALGKPTNDIGTAVEFIKEAINPPSEKTFTTERRFTVPSPAATRVKFVTPAIDSKEAAKRYNGMMLKADT